MRFIYFLGFLGGSRVHRVCSVLLRSTEFLLFIGFMGFREEDGGVKVGACN